MTCSAWSVCLVATLVGPAAVAGLARGQQTRPAAGQREAARELLREGNRLHDRGQYEAALERYRRAQAMFPSHRLEFNIGLTLQAMGQAAEAAERFEAFLRSASEGEAERLMVEDARSRLAALRRTLARLELAGAAGSRARVDGRELGALPLGRRLYLAPGAHSIAVERPGGVPFATVVTLEAGELRRLEVPPVASYAAVPVRAAAPPRDPPRRPWFKRWWLWTAVGVVVAGGVVAGVVASTRPSQRLPAGELGVIE
jgi:hypothetical protein